MKFQFSLSLLPELLLQPLLEGGRCSLARPSPGSATATEDIKDLLVLTGEIWELLQTSLQKTGCDRRQW